MNIMNKPVKKTTKLSAFDKMIDKAEKEMKNNKIQTIVRPVHEIKNKKVKHGSQKCMGSCDMVFISYAFI